MKRLSKNLVVLVGAVVAASVASAVADAVGLDKSATRSDVVALITMYAVFAEFDDWVEGE